MRFGCKAAAAVAVLAAGMAMGQTLPAGHPSMEQMMSATQPGAEGGMPGGMPPGHPSMGQMMGGTTQPKATGKLTVGLVAGTAGGKLAENEAVTIELYHRGAVVKKYDLKADANGKVTVTDVPLMPPVQALVSVNHAGLMQQIVSEEMNMTAPEQALEMKVFETTDEAPAWNVAMQHMIVQWNEDGSGARVVEMISTSTPGDRIWLGTKAGEGRVTMTVPLPAEVEGVEPGPNFEESTTKMVGGRLVSGGPLFPGRSEYRLAYSVKAKNGALTLPIAAPAAVGSLMVFLPADGTQVTATGLDGGQVMDIGDGKVRVYSAKNVGVGSTPTLAISGIGQPAGNAGNSKWSAKNLAIGGAFLMLLVAIGMMLAKKPQGKKA